MYHRRWPRLYIPKPMVLNFLLETFVLGVKNIRMHKLRSLLTTLGIVIGVVAVIVMVAIGEGGKRQSMEELNKLGAQNVLIRSVPPPESTAAQGRQQRFLTYGIKDLDFELLKDLPGLRYAVPLRDTQQKVIVGDRLATVNAIGTTPEIFEVINLKLERGRTFDKVDMDSQAHVCVLGALACQQLFPYQNPIGQKIQVGSAISMTITVEVIGVLEKTGLRPGTGIISRIIDQDLYLPLTLAESVWGHSVVKIAAGGHEFKRIELSEIWLQTLDKDDVEATSRRAENLIQQNHSGPLDYEIKIPLEIMRAAEATARRFNFILGGIASCALLVGGIGIMNIMLASVTERTREIGIRRALGAKRRHITLQFLVETTLISLAGGLIGIGLGIAIAVGIPDLMKLFGSQQVYPTSITAWSVIGSFLVSGIVGVAFGLYPAMTAAKMDPIEALRHE